jgi:hypothetical protein
MRARKFLAKLGRIAPREGEGVFAVIARSACDDLVRRSSTSEGGSNPFFLYAEKWIASLRSQ